MKIITENRAARHEFFILETYEAGIELCGTEVKSIRAGHVNLKESWASTNGREVYIKQMQVSPYEQGNIFNRDPMRERRLLLHKKEILKLHSSVQKDGCTLIPLSLYFKDSKIKVKLGLCKGKKLYDKRQTEKERTTDREIRRTMRVYNR